MSGRSSDLLICLALFAVCAVACGVALALRAHFVIVFVTLLIGSLGLALAIRLKVTGKSTRVGLAVLLLVPGVASIYVSLEVLDQDWLFALGAGLSVVALLLPDYPRWLTDDRMYPFR